MVGFLVNTLVLPLSLSGGCTSRDLIGRARASVEAALVDQDLPFERLVDDLGVTRSLEHSPVFQAMLALRDGVGSSLSFPGLEVASEKVTLPTAKFDLTLSLGPTPAGGLAGGFEYDADLFDAGSVARWARGFELLIEGLVESPDRSVLSLPLLSAAERSSLLASCHRALLLHLKGTG